LSIAVKGYDICHNAEEVIEQIGYDAELDVMNPAGSVFCTKGSGFLVPWHEVKEHMHVERFLKPVKNKTNDDVLKSQPVYENDIISLEEIDTIMNNTHFANQGKKNVWKKRGSAKDSYYTSLSSGGSVGISYSANTANNKGEEYLLVDGYNIIHAWPELIELAKDNMDAARSKLMDILSNYQPIRRCKIMLVFDAYRVEGRKESVEDYHNISVVFTAEAQTADQFIEKFAHSNKQKLRITVATSDGLQQIIIRGAGAGLLSARELLDTVVSAEEALSRDHLSGAKKMKNKLEDVISEDIKDKLKKGTSE